MSRLRVPVADHDHSLGQKNAPITLVEYGDYQCPFCAAAHSRVKRILKAMPGDIRYVFRHFPLTQVHEYAFLGSMAAEAAGTQQRFWDMHDMIFENQELLSPEGVFEFAGRLGLDLERFQSDLENEDLKAKIQSDFMAGVRSGVNGTPTFFLNNERVADLPDTEILKEIAASDN